jgi:serine/threonine-protein kinase
MTTMPPRVVEALTGRYRVEREIGAGGMATVFLAEDLKHHRRIALKVLKPELAAILGAERFLQEIEVTANLQHPNILPLYDSGEAAGFLYYVMPFVEGESLRDRLNREKQLPVNEATRIADAVAAALQFAHEHGVVHRDIKPENILLQSGQALVADFGIALAVSQAGGSRLTETGLSLGTPHYMSPEQATGDRAIDARSDIYALGCVLYEMLGGEPPHLGTTVQAVVAKILTDDAEPVRKRRKTVPLHVDAAVQKALAKLPADRFASAAEFRAALSDPSFTVPHVVGPVPGLRTDWRTRLAVPMTLAAALLAVLAAVGWRKHTSVPDRPVIRLEVPGPDSTANLVEGAVSPDGQQVLIVQQMSRGQQGSGGQRQFFFRDLSAMPTRSLPIGDPYPSWPEFSPDQKRIAFISLFPGSQFTGRLKVVSAAGGPLQTIADSAIVTPWWGADGYIYFSAPSGTGAPARLVRVASTGGQIDTLLADDSVGFFQPRLLPGEKGAIAVAQRDSRFSVVIIDLEERTWQRLDETGAQVVFAPPRYLLYNKGRFLMAAEVDVQGLKLTRPPVPISGDGQRQLRLVQVPGRDPALPGRVAGRQQRARAGQSTGPSASVDGTAGAPVVRLPRRVPRWPQDRPAHASGRGHPGADGRLGVRAAVRTPHPTHFRRERRRSQLDAGRHPHPVRFRSRWGERAVDHPMGRQWYRQARTRPSRHHVPDQLAPGRARVPVRGGRPQRIIRYRARPAGATGQYSHAALESVLRELAGRLA